MCTLVGNSKLSVTIITLWKLVKNILKKCTFYDRRQTFIYYVQYKYFVYRSNILGYVSVFNLIDYLICYIFTLTNGNEKPACPFDKAYKFPSPLNALEVQEVAKIIKYIALHVEYHQFYHSMVKCPQLNNNHWKENLRSHGWGDCINYTCIEINYGTLCPVGVQKANLRPCFEKELRL